MTYDLICVGASWGGLAALATLLESIPDEVDAPIVIAQHRAPETGGSLEALLQQHTRRPVIEASDKEPLERSKVYSAPPDYHLLVEPGSLALSVDDRVMYARPSVDVLFESAADSYGERTIGIVLTGANQDGAQGLRRIKERGGVAIVQEPETAAMRMMPDAAIAATHADAILSVREMGKFLYGLCCATEGVRA
jgi:two-component system, chemotaxis family, protein-glutamate methylesterase/glutaminase